MSQETDALTTAAASLASAVDAAMTTISGLVARLPNPADVAAIVAVTNDLQAKAQALTSAIASVPQ